MGNIDQLYEILGMTWFTFEQLKQKYFTLRKV